jgi:hypothetical protein
MRSIRRLGDVLIGLGATVGVVALGAFIGGFEPSRLPPALLNLAAYKLAFIAAAGLLVVGAVIARLGPRTHATPPDPARLPPLAAADIPVPHATPERQEGSNDTSGGRGGG